MAAYLIAEIDVHDMALYDKYRALVPATVAKHGGRFLVRGGAVEPLEGGWTPKRIIVLEFPSMEKAKAWYNSPDYQEALPFRLKASTGRVIFVEGAPPG
jgi:uncharacterized protein (DUF1330 family)